MDLLDGTIVNVAAPTIRADLGASLERAAVDRRRLRADVRDRPRDRWPARRHLRPPPAVPDRRRRVHDRQSRCAASPSSPEVLIAFRLLQGAFAAVMIPQGFGILRQVFPPDEIHKAFGLFGPVIGLSAVRGPDDRRRAHRRRSVRSRLARDLPRQRPARPARVRRLARSCSRSRAPTSSPTLDLGGAALVSLADRAADLPADPGPRGRTGRRGRSSRSPPACSRSPRSWRSSAAASAAASPRS